MEYQAWGVPTSHATVQVFLASSSASNGVYVNKLQLGPIRADLSANYEFSAPDKIDVSFIDIAAFLGPLRLVQKVTYTTAYPCSFTSLSRLAFLIEALFLQDFGGRGGFWKLTYSDDDLRILYTNQGNVFVLKRADY